jgi:hypothetical protein
MAAMEQAVEWLDEAIYLGKKVLVHCRHGHGRTGTFVSAYLLRRGLGLKKAEKILKNTRANPTNYAQWKLLRKYNKKQGVLTLSEPQAESSTTQTDLTPFLQEYEAVLSELETDLGGLEFSVCGKDSATCCEQYFELHLAESVWIHNVFNRKISQDNRQQAMERAMECFGVMKTVKSLHENYPQLVDEDFKEIYAATRTLCPVSVNGKCLLFNQRPFRCRWHGSGLTRKKKDEYQDLLVNISHNMYLALTGAFPPEGVLRFTMADTVSGRFVQACFDTMLANRF